MIPVALNLFYHKKNRSFQGARRATYVWNGKPCELRIQISYHNGQFVTRLLHCMLWDIMIITQSPLLFNYNITSSSIDMNKCQIPVMIHEDIVSEVFRCVLTLP